MPYRPEPPATFWEQMGVLAEKKSGLLKAEAQLWDQLSALLLTQPPQMVAKGFSEAQPSHPPSQALLTPKQAAEYLHTTPATLAIWRTTGRYNLPFVKVGRLVRYRREDVEAYVASRQFPHTTRYFKKSQTP